MIQRIQSVYLFLSFVLMALMMCFPFAEFLAGDNIYTFNYNAILENSELALDLWPVAFMVASISLISLVSIFLYKKRTLQMRLCIYNMLLMVSLEGFIFYYAIKISNFYDAVVSYKITVVFPVVALILTYLAFRGIRKDEILVKSFDRIR